MRYKKIRGIKRKLNAMVNEINRETEQFPTEFYRDYWAVRLPVPFSFIESPKVRKNIKRQSIQALVDAAQRLMMMKPDDQNYRVVVYIDEPLWNAQIIVFSGDAHFQRVIQGGLSRNWTELPAHRSIQKENGISIPDRMDIVGYHESFKDEDGDLYESEIWLIGDIEGTPRKNA